MKRLILIVFIMLIGLLLWHLGGDVQESSETKLENGHKSVVHDNTTHKKPVNGNDEGPLGSLETRNLQSEAVAYGEHEQTEASKEEAVSSNANPEEKMERVLPSRRMVAAHASLLNPVISDPESKENKEILQTMMFKALADPSASTEK